MLSVGIAKMTLNKTKIKPKKFQTDTRDENVKAFFYMGLSVTCFNGLETNKLKCECVYFD